MKRILSLIFLFICASNLVGCEKSENESANSDYRKISAQEAKEMLDQNKDILLVDVRSEEEFKESHIEGAILIPSTEIASLAKTELPDKQATILIYCRSGNRSATASKELIAQGYSNIFDFGGINDWPYETVK